MGVIAQKDSQSNRYYLHEVIESNAIEKINKEASVPESDGTSALLGDLETVSDTETSINRVSEVKKNSNSVSETRKELKALGKNKKQSAQQLI